MLEAKTKAHGQLWGRHSAQKYMYEKLQNVRILRDICPKNIFSLDFGANALCPVSYYPCQGPGASTPLKHGRSLRP